MLDPPCFGRLATRARTIGRTCGSNIRTGRGGEPQLLAPSLAPQPVLSLCWLPSYPAMARLALSGGYLWYTDSGVWHHA